MKAAVIHAFGEAPRFEEFAEPTLNEGDVLVTVHAAGLHPIVRALAGGRHYGSTAVLPMIPGIDGVGSLEDGTRVYFGMTRPPYGTMAEWAAVPRSMCLPLPGGLDDTTAAALFNPGISSWLSLTWRAQLAKGETVLILGATGASGQLAIQIARLFGAGKVIALGRNPQILSTLQGLGADAVLSLEQSDEELVRAIVRAAGDTGVHVIIDYIWGHPTEVVIDAITRKGLTHAAPRVRLVEVGSMGGPTITLPASVLRSSGLEIYGSGAGTVPVERIMEAMPQFIAQAVSGNLHIATEEIALADVADAWERPTRGNRRIVFTS